MKIQLVLLFLACAAAVNAGPEAWLEGKTRLTEAGGALATTQSLPLLSRTVYPVDPARGYLLSGEFRRLPGKSGDTFWFGLLPLDELRRPITPMNALAVPGTESVLAVPCRATDSSILIRTGATYVAHRNYLVAFDADDSGQMRDLPNFNTSPCGIRAVTPENGAVRISFDGSCGYSRPAGTVVRMHSDGPSYLYTGAADKMAPETWTVVSGQIGGVSRGSIDAAKFPVGTRYVRIVILPNYRGEKNSGLEFRSLSLKEQKKGAE